jgi:GNAT superfamily N-acetyltransferase
VEVRAIGHDEIGPLGVLTVAAYQGLEDGGDLGDYAEVLADVTDRAARASVLVAVDGDELLGGVTFVPDEANPYAEELRPGETGIRMLAVAPSAQGRGAGRALVVACVDRSRGMGASRVALHSTPWMRAAHHLYDELGFRRVPDRDLVVPPDVTLLSFVLDLGQVP